jgi:hypothetical protein
LVARGEGGGGVLKLGTEGNAGGGGGRRRGGSGEWEWAGCWMDQTVGSGAGRVCC